MIFSAKRRSGRRPLRQALKAHLQRFEMNDVDERDVAHQRRHQRMLDDVGVADPGELGDQERRGAHHRRRQLTVRRRRHLDRAGLLRREKPVRFISGMVKVPVVTVLAIDEPE